MLMHSSQYTQPVIMQHPRQPSASAPLPQVLTIMEKRGTRHTRRAASAAAASANSHGAAAAPGASPELEAAADAASAAAADRGT